MRGMKIGLVNKVLEAFRGEPRFRQDPRSKHSWKRIQRNFNNKGLKMHNTLAVGMLITDYS